MVLPKKYVRDRVILLLVSFNAFLVLLTLFFILIRFGQNSGDYFIQCRDCSDPYQVNKFSTGSLFDVFSFAAFGFVSFAISFLMSAKTYRIHRQLSVIILFLGIILSVFNLIVSYTLMSQR